MITYVYVYQWVFDAIPDLAGGHVTDMISYYWVFAGLAPLQVRLASHGLIDPNNSLSFVIHQYSRPASWGCLPASGVSTAARWWTSSS